MWQVSPVGKWGRAAGVWVSGLAAGGMRKNMGGRTGDEVCG